MIILYILAGIGGLFVLLVLIGALVGDQVEEQINPEEHYGPELKEFVRRQRKWLAEVEAVGPNIWFNSFVMFIVQYVFMAIGLFLVGMTIYFGKYGTEQIDPDPTSHNDILMSFLIFAAIAFTIGAFARMVRRRNRYIRQLRGIINQPPMD